MFGDEHWSQKQLHFLTHNTVAPGIFMSFRFIVIACLLSWISVSVNIGSRFVSAQDVDSTLEPLLRDFNIKSAKISKELEEKLIPIRQKFIAAVVAQSKVLREKKDDAALNDLDTYLTKVEAAPDTVAAILAICGELAPLHTGLHGAVADFLMEVNVIDKEYAPKLERLKQAAVKSVKQQLAKGKRNPPGFDTKAQKFLEAFTSLPNPQFDRVVPTLPVDDKEAERLWKKTRIEFNLAFDRDILELTNRLFAELYKLHRIAVDNNDNETLKYLNQVERAFRSKPQSVEQAFEESKQRGKTDLMNRPQWRTPMDWIIANQKNLPDPIEAVLIAHAKKCAEVNGLYSEALAKLDASWAGRNAKELKKLLLSDAPLEVMVKEAKKHMSYVGEKHEWLNVSYTYPFPDADADVMDMMRSLEESAQSLVLEADKQDATARNNLIAKLKEIPDADAVQESGRLELMALLTSDYGEGIRGTLIFEADDRLSSEARQATQQYITQAETLREKVYTSQATKVNECRNKLKSKRTALIQKNDFFGALLIDLHLARRSYPIRPIWIRNKNQATSFDRPADFGQTGAVQLLARSQKKGFLTLIDGRPTDWQPRNKVALSFKEFSQSEAEIAKREIYITPYAFNPKHPASKPVEVGMRLKPGDQVIIPQGNTWAESQVADVSPFGVVIESSRFGTQPSYKLVIRSNVRWINEQKVE